ncbi:FHA domain-containing protein [Streptacidiphilus sp. N1-3]|uniref:FHA domain-containing protein n=1 Tax=Streptacidiphilus alkalitolerans TaxID=3342712 RepID=A0ABV6WT95_9ACTN
MGTESHLSLDPAAADFAVDMSNVMKTADLCSSRPVDLARFVSLIDGLISHTRDETVQVYAVADASLLRDRRLSDNERATLRNWYQRGLIEVMDVADDRLIELADTTGQAVVSRDNYKEYCRSYPWIAGNSDRFFRPCPGPGGVGVGVEPRVMPTPGEWEISRKEEEGLLLGAGMYDRSGGTGPRRALLSRRWSCPEADCPLFGADRGARGDGGDYQPVPKYRHGVVLCPTHQLRLIDIGPYPRRVQVKARVDGTVRTRFLVAPRQEVAVGRIPGGDGIALAGWVHAGDEGGGSRVSRSHVTLRWDGWKLRACDTSRNGTTIRRVRPAPEEFRLPPGEYRRLRPGDEIVLADGVELIVSGREFIFEEATEAEVPPPDLADRLREEAQQETEFALDSSLFDLPGRPESSD